MSESPSPKETANSNKQNTGAEGQELEEKFLMLGPELLHVGGGPGEKSSITSFPSL